MSGAAAGLRRRARRLERIPTKVLDDVARDVDQVARRIGGTMSGLGGQLRTRAIHRAGRSRADARILAVPRAAWGVAQGGARRHPIGRDGELLRVGPGVRTGPVPHPGVRARRAWSRVVDAGAVDARRRGAREVHGAVSRG